MIGHCGVGGDPNLAFFAERANQGEEMMAVLVGGKYGFMVVAALGEMKPVAASVWAARSEVCVAFALRIVYKCVLEGKILTYFAKNAFGRWFCAEGKGQVVDLREVATKVSHPVDARGWPCFPVNQSTGRYTCGRSYKAIFLSNEPISAIERTGRPSAGARLL